MQVVSHDKSIQRFLFHEGLEKYTFSDQENDPESIQRFTDHFCQALKKADTLQADRFITFSELLFQQDESLSSILNMQFFTCIFPQLQKSFSAELVKRKLPLRLLALFKYYLILENNWL